MIATGVQLKEILNTLCLIIDEQPAGTLASVLLLNVDGVHLDCIAGPNLPKEWAQQMENLPIGPCAGSCGLPHIGDHQSSFLTSRVTRRGMGRDLATQRLSTDYQPPGSI